MLRQASSRNHRSKGFKVKNALQICLLIAICIWLLYQIKHSHEKKKAFEERNSKNLNKVIENPEDFFKLGRKGLPLIDETVSENEALNKEDEKENENENEEAQEEEPATKQQEEIEDDEGRGDGVDDIDEQDQEKGEEEAENGEESPEEGDSDSHDEMDLFDNHEHEGGSQEAREENYKRDDASSAVVHDTHATESENSDGDERSMDEQVVDKADDGSKQVDDSSTVDPKSDEDSNGDGSNHDVDPSANGSKNDADTNADSSNGEAMTENLEKKIVESENVTNGTDDGSRGDAVLKDDETLSTGNLSLNGMADNKNIEADNKDLDIEVSKPGNGSVANSTIVEDKSQMEQKDDSSVSADDIAVSNNTINSQLAQDQSMKGDGATQGEGEQNNSRNVETKEYSTTTSSSANENGDAGHEESENLSHAVVTEEGKVDPRDLSTLPDIQSELKSTDDEAAE